MIKTVKQFFDIIRIKMIIYRKFIHYIDKLYEHKASI